VIAIDTSVLLRYLLWDDKTQAAKADSLINGNEPVLVTDVVLVETLWTLKGKKYRLDKAALVGVLDALFEDDQTVWLAQSDYWQAKSVKVGNKKKAADLAAALIVNKARFHAAEKGSALNGMYTFERAAQTISGTAAP